MGIGGENGTFIAIQFMLKSAFPLLFNVKSLSLPHSVSVIEIKVVVADKA